MSTVRPPPPPAGEAELRELLELIATIINHDLRNPLSAITTAAHLIGMRAESERVTRPLARIASSAERIDRIISQVVDLARIRLGTGLHLQPEPMDLAVVARHAITGLAPDQRARIEVMARGDTAGLWDRARLPAVVSHLIENACEHGTAGQPVTVIVDGGRPDWVQLDVHNHGAIPRERLDHLFEALDATTRRRHRRDGHGTAGLGLGLYLSQQIAHAHGGSLAVGSDPDDGTRVSLALPRQGPSSTP